MVASTTVQSAARAMQVKNAAEKRSVRKLPPLESPVIPDADSRSSASTGSRKRSPASSGSAIGSFERTSLIVFAQKMFPYWSTYNVGVPFIIKVQFHQADHAFTRLLNKPGPEVSRFVQNLRDLLAQGLRYPVRPNIFESPFAIRQKYIVAMANRIAGPPIPNQNSGSVSQSSRSGRLTSAKLGSKPRSKDPPPSLD